jgi:hypothetical protein
MKNTVFILIAAVGCWVGCAYQHQAHEQLKSDGLTLQILVPSLDVKPDGMLPAFLILSNGSPQAIRYTALGNPLRGSGGDRFDIAWMPGWYFSDAPDTESLVQSVQALQPGNSIRLPFEMIVGTNKTLHVTASYDSELNAKRLGLWSGRIEAEPMTIRFDK